MRRLASPAAPRAAALSSADAPAGRTGRLVALVLACATVTATTTACSSSSSAGSGGDAAPTDAPDTSPATGAFTITASASALRSQLTGGFKPAAGHVFLLTDVTLANASVSTPLPMTSVFFTVTTAAAIVVHASPMSASTDAPCRIDVAVAAGGTAKCTLAFELATTDVATTLGYDDAQGHQASTPLSAIAPLSACETIETWTKSATSACRACETASCSAERSAASSGECSLAQSCLDACTSCACRAACGKPACKPLVAAYDTCLATKCSTACQ